MKRAPRLDERGTSHRRALVCGGVALIVWPGVAWTQPATRPWRVGFLADPVADENVLRRVVEPFRQQLRELGYVEGRNLVLEFRWADGKHERLAGLASELLRLKPDVLVAAFPAPAFVLRDATRSVPVVAIGVDNPVAMKLASSMARPGGNVTGVSAFGREMVEKRLQLLRELVPGARRFAILFNPNAVLRPDLERGIAEWEKASGAEIRAYEARVPEDFEVAFAAMARDGIGGLLVLAEANTYVHRVQLNALCLQRRMPSVWGGRDFLTGGAIASYQSDLPTMFRRGAALVDKILKGEKPAEIAFEQSTKLELVIDLRAAKALGIEVPRALLVAADEVLR